MAFYEIIVFSVMTTSGNQVFWIMAFFDTRVFTLKCTIL